MTGKSLIWLKYDVDNQDKTLVKVCGVALARSFDSSIREIKNYPSAWISGLTNYRASNITDHAATCSEQHKADMLRLGTGRAPLLRAVQSLKAC